MAKNVIGLFKTARANGELTITHMNWKEFEDFASRVTQWLWQPEKKCPEVPVDASWGEPTKEEEKWADAWIKHFFENAQFVPLSPRDRYILLPRFRYALIELSLFKTLSGYDQIGDLKNHVQKIFIDQWHSSYRAKWLTTPALTEEEKASLKKSSRERKREIRGKKCGLCGKKGNLTQTPCCGEWICDDEHEYVAFSFEHNSCSRNHRKRTLCHFHYAENHAGNWWECAECRKAFSTSDYVYYGTNEYNFRKLENPPTFDPIRCVKCNRIIEMGKDNFSEIDGKYHCEQCDPIAFLH